MQLGLGKGTGQVLNRLDKTRDFVGKNIHQKKCICSLHWTALLYLSAIKCRSALMSQHHLCQVLCHACSPVAAVCEEQHSTPPRRELSTAQKMQACPKLAVLLHRLSKLNSPKCNPPSHLLLPDMATQAAMNQATVHPGNNTWPSKLLQVFLTSCPT
jgi:hypothetical protein